MVENAEALDRRVEGRPSPDFKNDALEAILRTVFFALSAGHALDERAGEAAAAFDLLDSGGKAFVARRIVHARLLDGGHPLADHVAAHLAYADVPHGSALASFAREGVTPRTWRDYRTWLSAGDLPDIPLDAILRAAPDGGTARDVVALAREIADRTGDDAMLGVLLLNTCRAPVPAVVDTDLIVGLMQAVEEREAIAWSVFFRSACFAELDRRGESARAARLGDLYAREFGSGEVNAPGAAASLAILRRAAEDADVSRAFAEIRRIRAATRSVDPLGEILRRALLVDMDDDRAALWREIVAADPAAATAAVCAYAQVDAQTDVRSPMGETLLDALSLVFDHAGMIATDRGGPFVVRWLAIVRHFVAADVGALARIALVRDDVDERTRHFAADALLAILSNEE